MGTLLGSETLGVQETYAVGPFSFEPDSVIQCTCIALLWCDAIAIRNSGDFERWTALCTSGRKGVQALVCCR